MYKIFYQTSPHFHKEYVIRSQALRFIEFVLLKIANDKKLGTDGLVRLYAAQDLLLYAKALESIIYREMKSSPFRVRVLSTLLRWVINLK
jgi:hypothetical protein